MFSLVSVNIPRRGDHDLGIMPEDYTDILEEVLADESGHRWEPRIRPLCVHYRKPSFSKTQRRAVWARNEIESRLYAKLVSSVAAIVPTRRRRAEVSSRSRSGDRGDSDAHDHQFPYGPILLATTRKRRPRKEIRITGVIVDPGSLKRNPKHPSKLPRERDRRDAFLDELTDAIAELPSMPATTPREPIATLPEGNFWSTICYSNAHPRRFHHV